MCHKYISLDFTGRHAVGTSPHFWSIAIQQNLPVKDTLNRGHLSIEDTACCPNYIELCTKLPLN